MRADFSELAMFFDTNPYPYIDLDYQNKTDNFASEYVQTTKNIANVAKSGNKFIEIVQAVSFEVRKEIQVIFQAADKYFSLQEACLIYKQTGSVLEVCIHFYEESISDIIFHFGLKGTVNGLILGGVIDAVQHNISKRIPLIAGLLLAVDYKLNPYLSGEFIDFIKYYNIPLFSALYQLRNSQNLQRSYEDYINYINQVCKEQQSPCITFSIDDFFMNLRY